MRREACGLVVSSSWAKAHAVLWRRPINAAPGDGMQVVFFEPDAPDDSSYRDLSQFRAGQRVLSRDRAELSRRGVADAASGALEIVTACRHRRAAELIDHLAHAEPARDDLQEA